MPQKPTRLIQTICACLPMPLHHSEGVHIKVPLDKTQCQCLAACEFGPVPTSGEHTAQNNIEACMCRCRQTGRVTYHAACSPWAALLQQPSACHVTGPCLTLP